MNLECPQTKVVISFHFEELQFCFVNDFLLLQNSDDALSLAYYFFLNSASCFPASLSELQQSIFNKNKPMYHLICRCIHFKEDLH